MNPSPLQSIKLGICTDGIEQQFLECILSLALTRPSFTYLEIGVAHGGTFRAVHNLLSSRTVPFKMIGIDPNEEFCKPLNSLPDTTIICATRAKAFETFTEELDFAFIDGCHSIPCATGDFLSIEPLVKPGGIVVFHDFGEGSIGQLQPHCNLPCNPRQATMDLNLFNNTRQGWTRLSDWEGIKELNGADCGVFQHN